MSDLPEKCPKCNGKISSTCFAKDVEGKIHYVAVYWCGKNSKHFSKRVELGRERPKLNADGSIK